jgi:SAM-dependent methyltransferase
MVSEFEKKVAEEYNLRFLKYGAQPKSSLWFSEQRQTLRFDSIITTMKRNQAPRHFSINDIGCGYGGFLKRLQDNFSNDRFSYVGFDLAKSPVEYCDRNYAKKGAKFYCSSIPSEVADYSVMSGTFNYVPDLTVKAWKDYLFTSLSSIWNLTQHSMIFNLMISEQDKITAQRISYIRKETVVNFCQRNFGVTYESFSSKLPKEITFCVCKT